MLSAIGDLRALYKLGRMPYVPQQSVARAVRFV